MILIRDSESVEMLMQRVLIAAPRLESSYGRPHIPEPMLWGYPKARRRRDGDAGRDRRRSRALAGCRRVPNSKPNGETTVPTSVRRTGVSLGLHHFPVTGRARPSRKRVAARATAEAFKRLELHVALGVTSEEMARYFGAAS